MAMESESFSSLTEHAYFNLFKRFIRSVNIVESVSSRKFLEAAMNTEDAMLFYTVFKFFEQRNVKMRGNPKFQPGMFPF